jgi:2'-5' RNA ligase
MDIRKALRAKLLKEGAHKQNKYGCLMVFLDVKKSDWDNMQNLIDEDDLYEPKGETGFGKEKEPHVTILYGFHTDVLDADIDKEAKKIKSPDITFGKISAFSNEKFDVLKFDVESDDLHDLNKKFAEFPHTNDYPTYHPHCTIAYLKPKMADKYIKKLSDSKDMEIKVEKIVYSKADSTKKSYKLTS